MTKIISFAEPNPSEDFLRKLKGTYATILADPPWRFQNSTGKVAPEHRRLLRYPTMELQEITDLPVGDLAAARSYLYLWVPNALLMEGLRVMKAWGFTYKANLVWFKIRKDRWPRWPRRRVLFPQCHRANFIRCPRKYAHAQARTDAGEYFGDSQAGTLT